jgi:B-box zinc finger
MNCANHSDQAAVAFCRTCGKPLCNQCTRDVRGVIYCESCLAARLEGTAPGAAPFVPPPGQTVYPAMGAYVPPPRPQSTGPNPAVAGILGAIPLGIGAVYNSQYAKGLAHLIIFILLIIGVNRGGDWDWLFGLGIAFFVIYQIIDAVRSAKAIQAGEPAPDPLGLGAAFGAGEKFEGKRVPAGAAVLIGLGVLFLLHTAGIFEIGPGIFISLILILLGVWLFARHWGLLGSEHTICQCEHCRTRRLMGPAMLVTLGVLILLDSTTSRLEFHRTWPALLLVIGVVKLIQSNASTSGHIGPLPPGSTAYPPSPPPPTIDASQTTEAPSSGEVKNV